MPTSRVPRRGWPRLSCPGPRWTGTWPPTAPLGGARLYALGAGTAAALAAVHGAGVVHRDVKPQNVILAPGGPRVVDFGIAHVLDGTSVTRTGVMTGTPGWISPEHYRSGAVGPEGDVFAWGALVAYAATGRLPFGSGAPDAVAFRIMSGAPDLDGVPDDLLPWVGKALAKDPGDRPAAAELGDACTALLAAQATTALSRQKGGDEPTLVADLVGIHWDLPYTDDPAWRTPPPHRSRVKLYGAVVAAALVVGGLGGAALAATYETDSAQNQDAAAPSSQPRPPSSQKTITTDATDSENEQSAKPTASTTVAAPARQVAPSPAYTRSDNTQPTIDEWAQARVPATPAEKAAAQQFLRDAADRRAPRQRL
ncbi:protein kinase [Streptomyces sp. ISL-1]|uniref:protein kinase domain-containing protein n=1 Tax=Streptomyces sp. ISL-1 TaxID=2817657 RepID=UPI00203514E8|nr:protein kinase [Streptomyces sp. ISL-1]